MPSTAEISTRVLVFAPIGRDGALMQDLLAREEIPAVRCATIEEVCHYLDQGCAALILTEEVFRERRLDRLAACLRAQPPWSDIPVLLFAGTDGVPASATTIALLDLFPNVTLLDRPIRLAVAVSIVRAALRARARQLEVRDLLVALEAAREGAEAASRLKDEFLATLSHELRTPLNAILGWTTMLRHGEVEPERVDKALEVIDRNARAQARLVEEVLDMARIITGKLRIELKPVALRPVIDAVVEALRPAADAKGIRIGVDAGTRVSDIRGDADRLQQVFWNLLSNAVKFTPPGGQVMVRLDAPDSHVRIVVTDNGIGLDPSFLPFAFDRFRQADQSVTRGHGGLGLGLAIVKHLVELHGGRVDVASAGNGQGATFTILLPVPPLLEYAPPSPAKVDSNAFALRFTGRRLLVVDDDPTTLELLKELFVRAQADVVAADSAAAAFESVSRNPPDVMIADIGMPEEDGYSLIARIRRLPEPAGSVPAIALSAYTRSDDRMLAQAAGFSEFIGKPASPEDLLSAVERLLGVSSQ
jgi:signal transduction histidine kinase/ActR/RegA family two-component response regulator